jgi:hypothetical protein
MGYHVKSIRKDPYQNLDVNYFHDLGPIDLETMTIL